MHGYLTLSIHPSQTSNPRKTNPIISRAAQFLKHDNGTVTLTGTIELTTPRGETLRFGGGHAIPLIAGPCVIESEEHVHFMAKEIGGIVGAFLFKASFDKPNLTSLKSFRAPGLKEGPRILKGVKAAGHA